MKIYLLRVTDEHSVFYAEPAPVEVREMDAQKQDGGLRGWLSFKYANLQRSLIESERRSWSPHARHSIWRVAGSGVLA
ncbi:MAG: hypothetical protein WKF84_17420 [Pyrinomonadaceae bacterium]